MANKYWEGFYWDGFTPEKIGAKVFNSGNFEIISPNIFPILTSFIVAKQLSTDDYYFTIERKEAKAFLRIKLWHKNAFLGATDSGDISPGKKCFYFIFDEAENMMRYGTMD